MQVLPHLTKQPFSRRQVAPEGRRHEVGFAGAVQEVSPRRGEEYSRACATIHRVHLASDFVGRQEIIGIQPLDIIALADRKGVVSGRRRTLVGLSDNRYALGGKSTSNRERLITGPVINDDDLFLWPALSHR